MTALTVQQIGDSLGVIFPKELGLQAGQKITCQVVNDPDNNSRNHDRQLIEDSFAEFEKDQFLTQEQMISKLGHHGFGK